MNNTIGGKNTIMKGNKNLKGYSVADCKYALGWAKKIMMIKMLGGKCSICKNDNIFVLDFHHDGEKKHQIAKMLKNNSVQDIKTEIKQCIILCRNCHQELHCAMSRGYKRKSKLLSLIGINGCKKCGHKSHNLASLDFHHREPNQKKFSFSDYFNNNDMYYNVVKTNDLMLEVEKCDVICRNCHAMEHIDKERFDNLREYIYHKIDNHSPHHKFDKDRVKKMHNSGMYASQIAKIIGLNRSTISNFLKKEKCLKFKGPSGLEQRWGYTKTKRIK